MVSKKPKKIFAEITGNAEIYANFNKITLIAERKIGINFWDFCQKYFYYYNSQRIFPFDKFCQKRRDKRIKDDFE